MKKIKDIVEKLQQYNATYRSGSSLVSDAAYDTLTEELRQLQPDHPFLQAVEPELLTVKKEVRHPTPMLSTEKAYTSDDLVRYKRKFATEEKTISFLRHDPNDGPTYQEQQLSQLFPQLTDLFTDESVPDTITEKAGKILYRFFT